MTRQELHSILETELWKRKKNGLPKFIWEHAAKKFYSIPNDLAIKHFFDMFKDNVRSSSEGPLILRCESDSGPYYFGIGLEDCDNITLQELKELYLHGKWAVYTWTD